MDPMEFGSVGVKCSINDTCDEKGVATERVTLLNLHFTNRERELWYGNSESPRKMSAKWKLAPIDGACMVVLAKLTNSFGLFKGDCAQGKPGGLIDERSCTVLAVESEGEILP